MTLFNDGISREPIKHKAEMIRHVVENADMIIAAAYGSSKDVPSYQSIHVPPDRIFVVGKVKNRLQGQARFIIDGYAVHLGKRIDQFVQIDWLAFFQLNFLSQALYIRRSPIRVI